MDETIKQETPSIPHCPSGLTSPCRADKVIGGGLNPASPLSWKRLQTGGTGVNSAVLQGTPSNSPFTAKAERHQGTAEDEEDDEGDDAHLWGCEPSRRANHPDGSHFPLVLPFETKQKKSPMKVEGEQRERLRPSSSS